MRLHLLGVLLVSAFAALPAAGMDKPQDEPIGLDVARALRAETVAAIDLHVTALRVATPPELPNKLQEFVVEGVVTDCFKGPLMPGQKVKYYAVTEGRNKDLGSDHIAFLKRAAIDKKGWAAVEAIAFRDTPDMKESLHKMFGHACKGSR